MFCTNCGAQMNEGAKFCPKCGTATGSGAVVNQQEQQLQQGTLQQPVQPQGQTGEYTETSVGQQPAQDTKNYTAPTPFQPYSSIDPNQGMVQKTAFKGKQVSVGSSGHVSFGKKNKGAAQNTTGGGTGSASGLATTGGKKKKGCLSWILTIIGILVGLFVLLVIWTMVQGDDVTGDKTGDASQNEVTKEVTVNDETSDSKIGKADSIVINDEKPVESSGETSDSTGTSDNTETADGETSDNKGTG